METLQRLGYVIHPLALNITGETWNEINKQTNRVGPIFNHNTKKQNDFRRRQCHVHVRGNLGIKTLLEELTTTILPFYTQLDTTHTLKNMVVLESLPGCQQQAWHTDFDTTFLNLVDVKDLPLGIIVALEDNTKFMVQQRWTPTTTVASKGTTVLLQKGQVLLFLGDLIHAGAAYSKRNIRLHAFIDSIKVPRTVNATYYIKK